MIAIFDLDGTISNTEHRMHFIENNPKDFDAFTDASKDDSVNEYVAEVLRALKAQGHSIHIFTGRNDRVRESTEKWLSDNNIPHDALRMRSDSRDRYTKDTVIKEKWLSEMDKGEILCAFDDRDRSVKFWRDKGIPCFQVAEGHF